jgi:hypothetical protein
VPGLPADVSARAAELEAHEALREAIRCCALAQYDRRVEEDPDAAAPELRDAYERVVLVDYAVVASFDDLISDHTVTVTLRTDGKCAAYRTLGLLHQAAADLS